ncbi:hypothetical protein NUM_07880 [Actinocatenispora comari]|uniref:Uncharacterized protein n=1 Tax=Actinocatenispora comari TaxID=2807577 RepID=A0A8J4AB55_9ACTN|nr:hypothetical protein NUM_07880 [Actinocatenispora comari]
MPRGMPLASCAGVGSIPSRTIAVGLAAGAGVVVIEVSPFRGAGAVIPRGRGTGRRTGAGRIRRPDLAVGIRARACRERCCARMGAMVLVLAARGRSERPMPSVADCDFGKHP